MLTFAGAIDFGNIEGNRFFVVISNNHKDNLSNGRAFFVSLSVPPL